MKEGGYTKDQPRVVGQQYPSVKVESEPQPSFEEWRSQQPSTSTAPPASPDSVPSEYEANLFKQFGISTMNYLMAKAIAISNEKEYIPTVYRDLVNIKEPEVRKQWQSAMQDEMQALEDRSVWELVTVPHNALL